MACILFLLTGNICACHIHLLLSRPGTFGGAEDWLVRPLAREGTHRVGQRLFVLLAKKATICASPTIKLFSRCPQPGPQASVSGHSWLLSVTAPCPLTCDPFIYPFAGNLNVLWSIRFKVVQCQPCSYFWFVFMAYMRTRVDPWQPPTLRLLRSVLGMDTARNP